MDKNEILKRLMAGESSEDIAKEMAAALNEAVEAKKNKEAEEAKKADIQEEKEAAADCVIAEIMGYYGDFHPEMVEKIKDIKAEDVVAALDAAAEFSKFEFSFKKHNPRTGIWDSIWKW